MYHSHARNLYWLVCIVATETIHAISYDVSGKAGTRGWITIRNLKSQLLQATKTDPVLNHLELLLRGESGPKILYFKPTQSFSRISRPMMMTGSFITNVHFPLIILPLSLGAKLSCYPNHAKSTNSRRPSIRDRRRILLSWRRNWRSSF